MDKKSPSDSAKPLYLYCKILPISRELKLKNCLFAFDYLQNSLPIYFKNFLRSLGHNHNHYTRSSTCKLETTRTNSIRFGSYNIKNLVTRNWNETITNFTPDLNSDSRYTFKKQLHKILLADFAEWSSQTVWIRYPLPSISFFPHLLPPFHSFSAYSFHYTFLAHSPRLHFLT